MWNFRTQLRRLSQVQQVVNYDLPAEIDEYVHRIGRTGRCGNLGLATSFYDDSQNSTLARSLVDVLMHVSSRCDFLAITFRITQSKHPSCSAHARRCILDLNDN